MGDVSIADIVFDHPNGTVVSAVLDADCGYIIGADTNFTFSFNLSQGNNITYRWSIFFKIYDLQTIFNANFMDSIGVKNRSHESILLYGAYRTRLCSLC